MTLFRVRKRFLSKFQGMKDYLKSVGNITRETPIRTLTIELPGKGTGSTENECGIREGHLPSLLYVSGR